MSKNKVSDAEHPRAVRRDTLTHSRRSDRAPKPPAHTITLTEWLDEALREQWLRGG